MKKFFIFLCFSSVITLAQPPVVGGFNVYYGDLHNHTGASDGKDTAFNAYPFARDSAKLDFFGLAEHDWLMRPGEWDTVKLAANTFNKDNEFVTFYGFEWSSSWGHVTVMGTDSLTAYFKYYTDRFAELVSWIEDHDALAIFNHPLRNNSDSYKEFDHFKTIPSDNVIGMELWNRKGNFDYYYYNDGYDTTDGGINVFDEALLRGWKIGALGAEDNHTATWGLSDYRMAILSNTLTRAALMDAIKARRFYSTLDKNIALSFKINGQEMGSTIDTGVHNVKIEAFDTDNEYFKKLQIIKRGIVVHERFMHTKNIDTSFTIQAYCDDYFYIKLTQDDSNEVISSPIFIELPEGKNKKPSITITNPVVGKKYYKTDTINVSVAVNDLDGTVERVEFYIDSLLVFADSSQSFTYQWTKLRTGEFTLSAVAYDNNCSWTTSNQLSVKIENPPIKPPIDLPKESYLVESNQVDVFPNPVHDNVTLSFGLPVNGILKIIDMQGIEKYSTIINSDEILLDASFLNSGIYFLYVQSKEFNIIRKIFKL